MLPAFTAARSIGTSATTALPPAPGMCDQRRVSLYTFVWIAEWLASVADPAPLPDVTTLEHFAFHSVRYPAWRK
jgi:hypothetical protein